MSTTPSIYTGFWTNWAEGQARGATLTLTSQHGAYLVAFLAVFVQLSGMHSWQILSYIFFQGKKSIHNQGGLAGQQLAVLRNVSSDYGALWSLFKASWKRRKSSSRPFGPIVPILLTAALHCAGFAIAGVFPSRVTSAKSEVLLRSADFCGRWVVTPATNDNSTTDLEAALWVGYYNSLVSSSTSSAARCYNTSFSSSNCNAFGRRQLPVQTTTHSRCPFNSTMCTNGTVVRLDSGYVDSLLDLGINSHPSDRVAFRKVIECAPLQIEGYSKTYSASNLTQDALAALSSHDKSLGNESIQAFFYGGNTWVNTTATYLAPNTSLEGTSTSAWWTPYRVSAKWAVPAQPLNSTFSPIPGLNRSDAQVELIFLTNTASYPSPVTDPWFDATVPVDLKDSEELGFGYSTYSPRHRVSVLGCADRTVVCNPNLPEGQNCTSIYLSASGIDGLSSSLNFSSQQGIIFRRFLDEIGNTLDTGFEYDGTGGLLAAALTSFDDSAALPDNQWILELQNWFAIVLTFLQIRMTEYVASFDNSQFNKFKTAPTPEEQWMCSSQMVQRNDYASFSVLGLAIILCTGFLLMAINLSLHTVWTRLSKDKSSTDQWSSMELLELQEAASESRISKQRKESDDISSSSSSDLFADGGKASANPAGQEQDKLLLGKDSTAAAIGLLRHATL